MFRAAAILLLIGVPALAQRYPFRNYGQEQGLTNLNPKCIVQDRIGFLWVGTQNGLYRYDGGRFEYFGVEHGLPANRVEALHEARDGTLWVGTTSGLARMTGDRFAAVPISSDTASVNSVGSDGQGRLFVGLDSGLAVGTVSEKETQFRVHLPPTEGRSVTGLHSEGSERTWFWCDKRICYYQSGQITVVSPELVPARRRSASVIVDRSGAVIARNGSTLFSMPKDTTRFERQETELPPSTESSALFLDNEGRLLAPTNAGIGRRNANGIWEYFGNNRGLLINQTTTVFQDREGSIWVGLAGAGIARWVGYGQWESWDSDDGLKSDAVWAIARDLKGTLWAGTESGLQYLTRSAAGNPRWVEKPVAPRRIDTIVPAKNGSTWVGSSAGLFARVDGRDGAAIGYGPDQGLANNRVHHAVFDAQDRLWVATAGGLFVGRVGAGPVRFSKMEIPGDDPSAVYERFLVDRDGQLWIGGSSGLSRFAAERWTRFGERDGLLKQPISRLAQSSDGSI